MAQTRTQTVSLGEHWNNLIESLLKSGRYTTVSEIMRDYLKKKKQTQNWGEKQADKYFDELWSGGTKNL